MQDQQILEVANYDSVLLEAENDEQVDGEETQEYTHTGSYWMGCQHITNHRYSIMRFLKLLLLAPFMLPRSSRAMSSTNTIQRTFQFVDFGASAPKDTVTIACDGRVPGATLELTHWNGNETPDQYYKDTSTEMALQFAKHPNPKFDTAVVLNNHFDTDGVLSVWTCLHPQEALKYEQLLKEGAEAGDFSEWSSDAGVKLESAIASFYKNDDEQAYESILSELPQLLEDFTKTGGKAYEALWKPGLEEALAGWKELQEGRATLSRGAPRMVLLHESSSRLPALALHRGLREQNLWKDTTRILRVSAVDEKYKYTYESIGHGWVGKLVDRHVVPSADGDALAKQLNEKCGGSDAAWKSGGPSGLVAICQTIGLLSMAPNDVADLLMELDEGCR